MASAQKCIDRLRRLRLNTPLNDDQVAAVFERIHQAALDIKAGRKPPKLGKRTLQKIGIHSLSEPQARNAIIEAAQYAAVEAAKEAELKLMRANLQVVKHGARLTDVERMEAQGLDPMKAVKRVIARDYTGRQNVASLEERVMGAQRYYGSKLTDTWEALGDDFFGMFQDKAKMLNLVRELRGEDSGDPMAKKGAKAFHDAAEELRLHFNSVGGQIGRLDDWGMPQHHSQEKVANAGNSETPAANRQAWVDAILPLIDRSRYTDDLGTPWDEARMREFLGKAWDTIATDGIANIEPGKVRRSSRANRHAESRQIHFKDAESVIQYWRRFGERSAVEILLGHIDTLARDTAFLEHFGPNPNLTYESLRDRALQKAAVKDPRGTTEFEGQANRLDELYDYAAGRMKPPVSLTIQNGADALANLNVAGKLGGAAIASFFGDKPMMEAVAHLNNLPAFKRWQTELSMFNPANGADRRALQREGLMLDGIRSTLHRFYDGLGSRGDTTGKLANAVMRMTGMQAVNDFRKGAFGSMLYSAIGHEIASGKAFDQLADSDVRLLRNYGITENHWTVWKLAALEKVRVGSTTLESVLLPSAIAKITDDQLRQAGAIGQVDGPEEAARVRREAAVKLLGAVNTESEFAIVTPGWSERALFYGSVQRGTVPGEIWRSVLQFKSFPWAYFQRAMDAVANKEGPSEKAAMVAYLVVANTLAGAMILQTREMLAGKDPKKMANEDWHKFWSHAFIQGGALGIYGDFLYTATETRYGSGMVEMMAGPTLGPLLELGIKQPLEAVRGAMEGKETHLAARTIQDLKGFLPGGNIWYAKAALDHLIWQNVMEALSPGYLRLIRNRTRREFDQEWWWGPGEVAPERAPDLQQAIAR
jgi:hypothetical protein